MVHTMEPAICRLLFLDICGMIIVINMEKRDLMKRIILLLAVLSLLLCGCTHGTTPPADIAATTLPVWEFTNILCQGTDLTVTQLVTDSVSCLHDYSLSVDQVKALESSKAVVISGAGLEAFFEGSLPDEKLIDASTGIHLICPDEGDHEDEHDHHGHSHENDPHIWLSPDNARQMAANICEGLCLRFPEYQDTFRQNLIGLNSQLDQLEAYGHEQLDGLMCRELITFHDGFAYLAESFDLTILEAVEEESGSEASARELIHLISLVRQHGLPAVFTEENGSVSAAEIISRETGVAVYSLHMAMSGDSYFAAMYHNIDILKEALG